MVYLTQMAANQKLESHVLRDTTVQLEHMSHVAVLQAWLLMVQELLVLTPVGIVQ